jgi:uncharacterized membrane protein YbhN (UPF0104 family)
MGRARSLLFRVGLTVVLAAAVAVAIIGIVPGSGRRVAHPVAVWIVAEVALELIACASYAWLFHGVFSYGAYTISAVRSTQIGVGELGAFAAVPAGAGGPVVRFWALMRSGMPFREVMIRSVIHAPILNLPYVAAAVLLGLSVILGVGPGHAPTLVALAPLGVIVVAVLAAVAATRYVRRRSPRRAAGWRRVGNIAVEAIPQGIRAIPARLREPALSLSATGYWAGDCGVLIVAFHAAHGSAAISVIVLAYMLGQLGNALPLPGGIGGVEPVMLGVLTASGVNLGLGAAAIVLYRFISLGTQTVAGAVAVATLVPSLSHRSTPPAVGPVGDGERDATTSAPRRIPRH